MGMNTTRLRVPRFLCPTVASLFVGAAGAAKPLLFPPRHYPRFNRTGSTLDDEPFLACERYGFRGFRRSHNCRTSHLSLPHLRHKKAADLRPPPLRIPHG
jgi:hypothetical protein